MEEEEWEGEEEEKEKDLAAKYGKIQMRGGNFTYGNIHF